MGASFKWEVFSQILPVPGPHEKELPSSPCPEMAAIPAMCLPDQSPLIA